MKKYITLFFLVFSIAANAQNWKTIVANDTNVFKSSNSGFVKNIYCDSVILTPNKTSFYFYPSLRFGVQNTGTFMDTIHDTWVGNRCVRNETLGIDTFFNVENTSLIIKTFANINESWTFANDCLGKSYIATVTSLGIINIDGIPDSIKTINIQTFQGASLVGSLYDTIPIILSKSHGFYNLFEFYSFPKSSISSCYNHGEYYLNYPTKPILTSFQHIDEQEAEANLLNVDLGWKYKQGNEWIIQKFNHANIREVSYTKILNSNVLTPNFAVVQYQYDVFTYAVYESGNLITPSKFTSDTIVDFISKDSVNNPFQSYKTLNTEFKDINSYSYFNTYILPFSDTIHIFEDWNRATLNYGFECNGDKIIYEIILTFAPYLTLSGGKRYKRKYLQDFGVINIEHIEYMAPTLNEHFTSNMIYWKLDSCIYGNYINVAALGINDLEKNNLANAIIIFPNPTNDIINIKLNESSIEIIDIQLFDIQGKKINLVSQQDTMKYDISTLSSGVYFLNIKTNKGAVQKKISKY